MKEINKYDANFTAGGLLSSEFKSLYPILFESNFIVQIEKERELNNFLGIKTESARKRIVTEIKRRYNVVKKSFWEWFKDLSEKEQKLALFYLCLKTYPIVLDIHIEVALKKYKIGNDLNAFSVKMRLDEIASVNDIVGSWSESTLDKLNSQYRTTLKECGLLKGERLSNHLIISDSFWEYFEDIGESWFKEVCFK
ncbi:MAG: DUF1819 family protein [Candidatus Delongbacteria bacterium]|nr:DUF1819 family protein [Candidatus Delongbacteria bacterium]MCG2761101.1 DUF1819 family protein [Candidatus Delongbacteria bacterium]